MSADSNAAKRTTIHKQQRALEVLTTLSIECPDLPASYLTLHEDGRVDPMVQSAADFEAWRAALGIDPALVELHTIGTSTWLWLETSYRGVPLRLTCAADIHTTPGVSS